MVNIYIGLFDGNINYEYNLLEINGMYSEGNFLGYVPLLEEKAYAENAEALEEVRMRIIPKSDFLTLIYSSKEVARKFIQLLSNNLQDMESRLSEIAYHSVRQRVASALLKINERFLQTGKESVITITRKDISSMVGTATESLNRTLADFKEEGIIEITAEGLKILSKSKLERILH